MNTETDSGTGAVSVSSRCVQPASTWRLRYSDLTINETIDRYGESAQGSLSVHVTIGLSDTAGTIVLEGTKDGFIFLGNLVFALLEDGDCKFHLEPFGAGSAYFQEAETRGPGLYLHVQPCASGTKVFPQGTGISWLCWAGWFDDVPLEHQDFDPSFVVLEAEEPEFRWLAETLLNVAANNEGVRIRPDDSGRRLRDRFWHVEFAIRERTQ